MLYTASEAAKRLRVSVDTIYNLYKDGALQSAFRVGKLIRIPESDIESIECGAYENTGENGQQSQRYKAALSAVRPVPKIVNMPSSGLTTS